MKKHKELKTNKKSKKYKGYSDNASTTKKSKINDNNTLIATDDNISIDNENSYVISTINTSDINMISEN